MKRTKDGNVVAIKCTVSKGMFQDERAVHLELADGRKVSAFVDKEDVAVREEPSAASAVSGTVTAVVVEEHDTSIILDLPQSTLTNGTRVEVNKEALC
jgi:hypothetical protein